MNHKTLIFGVVCAVVIGLRLFLTNLISAVVPTVIATMAFLPRHLIPTLSQEAQTPQPAEVCVPDLNGNGHGAGLGDE